MIYESLMVSKEGLEEWEELVLHDNMIHPSKGCAICEYRITMYEQLLENELREDK